MRAKLDAIAQMLRSSAEPSSGALTTAGIESLVADTKIMTTVSGDLMRVGTDFGVRVPELDESVQQGASCFTECFTHPFRARAARGLRGRPAILLARLLAWLFAFVWIRCSLCWVMLGSRGISLGTLGECAW